MECMHDLRPDPEVSPPEIPPKLTPGRLFDKLWSATTGNPKVWSERCLRVATYAARKG